MQLTQEQITNLQNYFANGFNDYDYFDLLDLSENHSAGAKSYVLLDLKQRKENGELDESIYRSLVRDLEDIDGFIAINTNSWQIVTQEFTHKDRVSVLVDLAYDENNDTLLEALDSYAERKNDLGLLC